MKNLAIQVKKTRNDFLDNYTKHDRAGEIVREYMKQRHIKIIDYGDDRRHEKVWEEGKDKPDALIWKPELILAFIDWKGHSDHKWMLNERAYNSYIKYGERYSLPVFCVWVFLSKRSIVYAKLPFENPQTDFMPHDSNYVIRCDDNEVRHIDNLLRELSLYKQLELQGFPQSPSEKKRKE